LRIIKKKKKYLDWGDARREDQALVVPVHHDRHTWSSIVFDHFGGRERIVY